MKEQKDKIERRQWLVRLGRHIILGGISILSLKLVMRRLNAGCIRPKSPCQSCGVFTDCGLPRAEESRKQES